MKCCVCRRVMRKMHYPGKFVCFSVFVKDIFDSGHEVANIEFPQPFCKRCVKSFNNWLKDESTEIKKFKEYSFKQV